MREPSIGKKNDVIVFVRKKIRTKRNTLFNNVYRIGIRIVFTFKATKPNRDTLSANAKRKEKNSKFVFAEHMVKSNMNIFIRMFNAEIRNNMINKSLEKRIGKGRKRIKETPKATFNRFKLNERKIIF